MRRTSARRGGAELGLRVTLGRCRRLARTPAIASPVSFWGKGMNTQSTARASLAHNTQNSQGTMRRCSSDGAKAERAGRLLTCEGAALRDVALDPKGRVISDGSAVRAKACAHRQKGRTRRAPYSTEFNYRRGLRAAARGRGRQRGLSAGLGAPATGRAFVRSGARQWRGERRPRRRRA